MLEQALNKFREEDYDAHGDILDNPNNYKKTGTYTPTDPVDGEGNPLLDEKGNPIQHGYNKLKTVTGAKEEGDTWWETSGEKQRRKADVSTPENIVADNNKKIVDGKEDTKEDTQVQEPVVPQQKFGEVFAAQPQDAQAILDSGIVPDRHGRAWLGYGEGKFWNLDLN